jgi:hypothetical protein
MIGTLIRGRISSGGGGSSWAGLVTGPLLSEPP